MGTDSAEDECGQALGEDLPAVQQFVRIPERVFAHNSTDNPRRRATNELSVEATEDGVRGVVCGLVVCRGQRGRRAVVADRVVRSVRERRVDWLSL